MPVTRTYGGVTLDRPAGQLRNITAPSAYDMEPPSNVQSRTNFLRSVAINNAVQNQGYADAALRSNNEANAYNALTPEQKATYTPTHVPGTPEPSIRMRSANGGLFTESSDNTEGIARQNFHDKFASTPGGQATAPLTLKTRLQLGLPVEEAKPAPEDPKVTVAKIRAQGGVDAAEARKPGVLQQLGTGLKEGATLLGKGISGAVGLAQGQAKIDETKRHNQAMEGKAPAGKAPVPTPSGFDHTPTTAESQTWFKTVYDPWAAQHRASMNGMSSAQDPGPAPIPPWMKKPGGVSAVAPDYTNNNATAASVANVPPATLNGPGVAAPASTMAPASSIGTALPAQAPASPAAIPGSPTGIGAGVLANTQPAAQHAIQGDQHFVSYNGQQMKIDPPAAPPGAKAMSYNAKYQMWQFKMDDGRIVDEQGKTITFGD